MTYFWVVIIILIVIYSFAGKKKTMSPEEIARLNEVKLQKEKEAELQRQKRLEDEKAKLEEEKARKEKLAAEAEANRLRLLELQKAKLAKFRESSLRVYFSYSFVSEQSKLYPVDPDDNSVIDEFVTTPAELYREGYRLKDADKTGQSAQLEDFNFILRFEKN